MTEQKTVLSGMRSTGKIHLGNYFGALKNWVDLQDRYRCFYFAADWHALTSDYADPSQIAANTIEMVTDWIAAGLDPEQVDDLHPVHGAGARRAPPAAVDAHAARLAGARAHLQGADPADREQGPVDLRLPRLPGAADGGHRHLPRRLRAGGRGPGEPPRDQPRDRAPVQLSLQAEVFPEPQALFTPTPKVPGIDGRKMSKSYGNAINLSDPPDDIRAEVHADVHRSAAAAAQRSRAGPRSATSTTSTSWSRRRRSRSGWRRSAGPPRSAASTTRSCWRRSSSTSWSRSAGAARSCDRGTVYDILVEGSRRARERTAETMERVRSAMGLDYSKVIQMVESAG